jgi:hypothetical protein
MRAAALALARAVPGHAHRHASSRPSRPSFAQTVQGASAREQEEGGYFMGKETEAKATEP